MVLRTDLAAELHLKHKNKPSGVDLQEKNQGPCRLQVLRVTSMEGSHALGKPVGEYRTLTLPGHWERDPSLFEPLCDILSQQIRTLLPGSGTALVTGLGNRAVTPDALGPFAAERVTATRHLRTALPELFGHLRSVSVLSPGVLGTTGIETAEILGGVIDRVQPGCLLAIDALCAEDSDRLCRTVQLCNTGITPGEGTGTARCQLDPAVLGLPVIALGIPTVTDVSTLVREQTGHSAREPGWLVTRTDIDLLLEHCVRLLSRSINMAFHPDLSPDDLALLTGA